MKSQFLIGAVGSGSGKTTITTGILRSLKRKNIDIQPFKCGPDYIDTKYHSFASGKNSINIDLFFSTPDEIIALYEHYSNKAEISICEGVMGLYDGADKYLGSTAHIAITLSLPVILVINAKAMSYSVAPLLYGFKNFNPELNLVGVIFNMVSSDKHYSMLKEAAEEVGVKSLGYLPANKSISVPSRHLGLNFEGDILLEEYVEKLANLVDEHINIDQLLNLTKRQTKQTTIVKSIQKTDYKIAIARDNAFSFTYAQNIKQLEQYGQVEFFSPISDSAIPACDFLYLPGGYPELYCSQLSSNKMMLKSVQKYINNGGLTFAECGGMMYLTESITTESGQTFPMVAALPLTSSMEKSGLRMGYRKIKIDNIEYKGHEFHYSHIENEGENTEYLFSEVITAKGDRCETKIYKHKKVIASYIHIYWGGNEAFNNFIKLLGLI